MNIAVLAICIGLGYLLRLFLPDTAWATYFSILFTYHLMLGWRIIAADHETGFSLPVFSTILTHAACLTLVVVFSAGRHYIPFFWLIRYFVPALAPFEVKWLYSGGMKKKEKPPDPVVVANASESKAATADDYEAWLGYLQKRNPLQVKAGVTIQQEYEEFVAARIKRRSPVPAPAPNSPD